MATAYFPSSNDGEVIEVEFVKGAGDARSLRLFVDSGFTGQSSLILPKEAIDLARAELPGASATGALQGLQDRVWVTCRIPSLSFHRTVIAILTDISVLDLPADMDGMAGLTFLRQFTRWGAEMSENNWQFFLSNADP